MNPAVKRSTVPAGLISCLSVLLLLLVTPGFAAIAPSTNAFASDYETAVPQDANYAYLLELGDDALLARVHLIQNAKQSIDIQTFIWAADDTGSYLLYELWQAAKRGVKVRILIDDLSLRAVAGSVAYLSTLHPNIEFKQYNPLAENIDISFLQKIGEFTVHFGNSNHRMHNKIVVVDDRYGITGGRNYQDDYFDRGVNRSFKDRDILIAGSIAEDMRRSFDEYWEDDLAVFSREMRDVKQDIEAGTVSIPLTAGDYVPPAIFDDLRQCAASNECLNQRIVDRGHLVTDIEFVADHPGKFDDGDDLAETTESIIELMTSAKDRIIFQTPYLVVGNSKMFKRIRKDNPDMEVIVSSNSLGAADHFYAYAFSYKNKKRYLKKYRWQIYEMMPDPADFEAMIHPVKGVERSEKHYSCIHAKTYLFDEKTVWLGSFNLDPRSVRLNTEAGVIIRHEPLFEEIKGHILRQAAPQNAWAVGVRRKIPIVALFNGIVENIFSLIPIANIWPFTYSTSFELREGGKPVPFYHDDFYKNYRTVGQFPGANASGKALKTRLTKAFFGPAEPII